MYITNRPDVAGVADKSGVDRIMIDLEKLGKETRQQGWNSIISDHNFDDIPKVKKELKSADLLVRINPMNENTKKEIDDAISLGADMLMLPFFKTADEVSSFISMVGKRVRTSLLLETKEAVDNIEEVHIGLNDLSHSYNANFLFQMFPMGVVDHIVEKLKAHGINNYGIGGIARLNHGLVPAEDVIAEHYRLGSKCAILSRAFCNADKIADVCEIEKLFTYEIKRIRDLEQEVAQFDSATFEYCRQRFNSKVQAVAEELNRQKVLG